MTAPVFEVLFVHGPAAAGKYTVGKLVAERLQWPFFHNHLTVDVVKTLFEFGSDEFCALRESIWLAAFEQAGRAQRSFVFTFNPENTVAPDLVSRLDDRVRAYGGIIRYVALECSDEEVVRRIGSDSRKQFGKLVDAAVFWEAKAAGGFDYPDLPAAMLTLDTEEMSPDAAASAIVEELEAINPPR